MDTLLFVVLTLLGVVGIAIAAFVSMVFLEAAFGNHNQDMFELDDEDF